MSFWLKWAFVYWFHIFLLEELFLSLYEYHLFIWLYSLNNNCFLFNRENSEIVRETPITSNPSEQESTEIDIPRETSVVIHQESKEIKSSRSTGGKTKVKVLSLIGFLVLQSHCHVKLFCNYLEGRWMWFIPWQLRGLHGNYGMYVASFQ